MSNTKMKGLLKGLRYISQIFDNEKEPEMQIGFPTDVKHVAHIGWDGPSVNSPSWMGEFTPGASSSAPLNGGLPANGDLNEDGSEKWVSEDSTTARELPELPKSSRRHSTGSSADSPTKEKADKQKQTRRSSRNATKDSADGTTRTSRHQKSPSVGGESTSSLPDLPKRSRRKKSKDSSSVGGGSSRSRAKAQALELDAGSDSGSVSKLLNDEQCLGSGYCSLDGGDEAEFNRIS